MNRQIMKDRENRLQKFLQEQNLEAMLISDENNMRYFSGFSGGTGFVYISGENKVILTDSRYTTQAIEEGEGFEVKEVSSVKGYHALLKELTLADHVRVLGFEDEVMLFAEGMRLKETLDFLELKGVGDTLNKLRMIKCPEELECIAKAEAIGDGAFLNILNILKPGMTELEVAVELEGYMKRHGATTTSFDTIAASGYHSAMPHATPSAKPLEKGDFLTMDFGCKYMGYCSDMTRTVVIGRASDRQRLIYDTVLKAQLTSLTAVAPGKEGCEVDAVARNIIKEAGYGDYFGHGLGHSVGLFIHEEPRLSPSGHILLQPNMTVTVEPGIYIPDFGGVRIEDLVVVTEDGYRNLASSPKELIEIF